MSRSEPLHLTVPLRREPRLLAAIATTLLVVALHSTLFFLIIRSDTPNVLATILYLDLCVLTLFAVLIRLHIRPRWVLSDSELTLYDRFRTTSIPCTRIERLGHISITGLHIVSFEGAGRRLKLYWWEPRHDAEFGDEARRFRDAVAARTGLRTRGERDTDAGGILQAIRREIPASAKTRRFAEIRWILSRLKSLDLVDIGIQGPLISFANLLAVFGHWLFFLAFALGLAFAGPGKQSASVVVVCLFLLLLAHWIFNLAANLVLLNFGREVRTREGFETELETAREVQQRLLPAGTPKLDQLDVYGDCTPAREIGGDYFDFLDRDGRTILAVADIAGKGLAAGLLMTLVKGCLGAALGRGGDLRDAALTVGEEIRRARRERRFVTLALAEIDRTSDRLRLLRAGHNPPLLVRGEQTQWLEPPGVALGLGRDGRFEKNCEVLETTFAAGDVLVLYTDGVTEALNVAQEEFGDERLREAVLAATAQDADAATIHAALIDALHAFRGEAPVGDDVTVVVARAA